MSSRSPSAGSSDLEFGGRVTLEDAFTATADRVSRRFRQFHREFASTILRVDTTVTAASSRLTRMAGAVGTATGALNRILGPMAGLAMGAARFMAIPLLFGIFALGRAAVRSSSEMEVLRLAFTTLLGSADAAGEHLRMLQQFAIGKPFEFRDLVVASRNLQTFGFAASEVRGLLTDFGDAAFNAGTGLRGVNAQVNVFGTILATNKVTFGQLRQLVRAGVPAFQILRDQLHLTDQQLRNIARSTLGGRVIIDALRRGMQQRFTGGMERAAQTITARISDLHDVAGIFLSQVGDELRPTILGFLNDFGQGLARTDFGAWAHHVADGLSTLFRIVRIGVSIVTGAISDLPGRTTGGLMAFLARVRDVAQGVEALLSSEGSNGMGRIPARMHATLIKNGLWPLALRIAQWGDRVRGFLRGFIEGAGQEIARAGARFRWLSDALGMVGGGMLLSSTNARGLGGTLASMLFRAIELRAALAALAVGIRLVTLAQTALNLVLNANPIGMVVLGVLALVGVTYILVRNWDRLAAAYERFKPFIQLFAILTLPITIMAATLLAVPVAIAYVITHWDKLKKSFTAGGKEFDQISARWHARLDAFKARVQLVRDAFTIMWAVLSTRAHMAFAIVEARFDRFADRVRTRLSALWAPMAEALAPVIARIGMLLYPVYMYFFALKKSISGEMKGLSSSVGSVFAGMTAAIVASLRGLAGDLVAAFRSLPEGLRPAGLGGAVERLDAFARGPQQPVAGVGAGAGGQPVPTPGTPTAPQLIVQRTQAQARAGSAASPTSTASPPIHVQPSNVVVQLNGREIARAVQNHNEDENIRGGGSGARG